MTGSIVNNRTGRITAQDIEQRRSYVPKLEAQVFKLKAERDAYAAKLEELASAASEYHEWQASCLGDDRLIAALAAVPTTNLAERDKRVRKEALEEASQQIADTWGQAYPDEGIFRELTKGEIPDNLRTRASASMGRHMAKCIEAELRKMAKDSI